MKPLKAAEIRSRFLNYFKRNGHTVVESSSLVPQNDPTLLFTNAGMVQFKDVFLGKDKRPYSRATTSQKCVRAGGKHNDLERVGFTARHHTFFEMLGNFSFGDYFKKEAIHYAWEFVTQDLALPKEHLYVTVFEKDDEAADLWHKQEGVSKDHIFRLGEKDNFWAMGDTGPCGPCSEIYIDRGEKYGCGKAHCNVGCDCDRFMEFWNLVFMQFNRDASGKLTPLPKPSVDTGAGLERIASILQSVETNYDADIFQHIISKTGELAKKPYRRETAEAVSFRVIADHARAATFLIGDGVLPSNEGRGYVLRRIMRRAIRHGKSLGFTGPFLNQVCGYVIEQMESAYPDLTDKRDFIAKVVQSEEEQFFKTLERGLSLLDEETAKLKAGQTLAGEVAFTLYDTYGFPLDLTRVICEERDLQVDEIGFEKSMEHQRNQSRKSWKGSGEESIDAVYFQLGHELKSQNLLPRFVGYDQAAATGKCLAVLVPKGGKLERAHEFKAHGAEDFAIAIFSETPLYGESGGQTGDRGRVRSTQGFDADVVDVQKPVPELIAVHLKIRSGTLTVGDSYLQETDTALRARTARNHTATHLLHWALREVLGNHVKQAGSLVTPDLLRFDFSHFQPVTPEELQKIEDLINHKIWTAQRVFKHEMSKDEAISAGAIAFFGEKYGDRVRVVSVGEFSTELCGGTHVDNSAEIHLFKITNENGIASGVRRIIAVTSSEAFEHLRQQDQSLKRVRDILKASSVDEIFIKLERNQALEKEFRKQIDKLQSRGADDEIRSVVQSSCVIGTTQLIARLCNFNPGGIKHLRDLSDKIRQQYPDSVTILGMKDTENKKALLIAAVGPKRMMQISAAEVLQHGIPLIEGRGGGKADMAQAGGTKIDGIEAAIQAGKTWVESRLKA